MQLAPSKPMHKERVEWLTTGQLLSSRDAAHGIRRVGSVQAIQRPQSMYTHSDSLELTLAREQPASTHALSAETITGWAQSSSAKHFAYWLRQLQSTARGAAEHCCICKAQPCRPVDGATSKKQSHLCRAAGSCQRAPPWRGGAVRIRLAERQTTTHLWCHRWVLRPPTRRPGPKQRR